MGFFDEMGAQLNRGKDVAEKKARALKIKGDISGLERERKEKFSRLGESFYLKQTDAEARSMFAPEITAIEDIDAKINGLRIELERLETVPVAAPAGGQIRCSTCGAICQAGDAFCISCGNKIEPPAPVAGIVCPNCGASVIGGSSFCFNCGAKIEATQPAPQPEPEPAAEPVAEPEPEPEPVAETEPELEAVTAPVAEPEPAAKICKTCGKVLDETDVFCGVCGTPVQ